MARPRGIIAKPPPKPRGNFPLHAHKNGSWVCRIDGVRKSFGGWKNDPKGEAAYLNWRVAEDARREGREAEPVRAGYVTCRDVVNALLADRRVKVDAGELDAGTYADYRTALRKFLAIVGADRSPYDLMPNEFAAVKAKWGETRGAHALGRWIQFVRTAFRHAGPDGVGLMDRPPRYGGLFSKPAAKLKRREIREAEDESGKRLFDARELAKMIKAANPTLKACIYLGINCGFLAIDCARLTGDDLDLKSRWHDTVRRKTETCRASVLWPETVKAVREAIKVRPEHAKEEYAGLLFLTREGYPLVHEKAKLAKDQSVEKVSRSDSLNQAMRDLLAPLKLKRKGVSFSALRKSFRTAADDLPDANAVNLVMGHLLTGGSQMAQHYVKSIERARMEKVASHVKKKLLR